MDHFRFHIDSMYTRQKVLLARIPSKEGCYFVWITAVVSRNWRRFNIIKDLLGFDALLDPIENCYSETIHENRWAY
jgi:hypothetical protein